MTPEAFLERFEQFAAMPNAVARIRNLVLQLAVQGKLVSQNANDESAEKLLAAPASIDCSSLADLPSKWVWARVNETGRVDLGRQRAPQHHRGPHMRPYLRVQNVYEARIDVSDIKEMNFTPTEFETFALQTGDLLLNEGQSRELVGRPAIYRGEVPGACFQNTLVRYRPYECVTSEYALIVFRAYMRSGRFQAVSKQTTNIAHLSAGRFAALEFPLPPLAEQKRIVAKVDELMALCDRLEEQQRERETRHAALARASLARFAEAPTPANLEFLFHNSYAIPPADLRKSILTLAVQGKLVPQDSKSEIGSLDSILAEASVNGVSKGPTSDKSATEILRISAGTSREDFYVNEDDFKHVDLPPDEIEKFQLAPGDLLACRFNGNLHYVGRFSFYRGQAGRVQVNPDKLIRFRIKTESHCPRYVCLVMNAAPTRKAIEDMCATTAGNIGLSAGKLKTVQIPLPTLTEQRRIVAKVDELMALIDALETQLVTAHDTAAKLMQAVVHDVLIASQTQSSPVRAAEPSVVHDTKSKRPNRHFARAVLSAEIVHQLHAEPTFGRIKHQKVFHLCESLARIPEVEGQYSRKAAGPFDNKLVYANESELKKQKWYDTVDREKAGHRYVPLEKAGAHARYVEQYWPDQLETIRNLIALMRTWDTDRCEIFSTTCAAWNDLLIWGREPTDEAILHEILNRWTPEKRRFPREKWLAAIRWMKEKGYIPTGFGRATAEPE